MKRGLAGPFLLAAAMAILAGCAAQGQPQGLIIKDAWVRPSPVEAGNGAAYLTIENHTGQDDALLAAASDIADAVEIHESMAMEGEMMGMRPVERIDVPAGSSVVLEPGGFHVMLIGLRQELREGDTVTLRLTFANAGEITIEAPVKEQ